MKKSHHQQKIKFRGYIKYFGPLTEDGSLDIAKAGRSLIALDRFFKKYQTESTDPTSQSRYILKISEVNNNCSEVVIKIVEVLQSVSSSTGGNLVLTGLGLKLVGVDEFGKKFFGTLGEQVALKIFSKGNKLKKEQDLIKSNKHCTLVKNSAGEVQEISQESWENYEKLNSYLAGFVQLEKGKEEEMRLGYKEGNKEIQVTKIRYEEKDYFDEPDGAGLDTRMSEPFDEERAKEERIVGRFVDFHGLAHKYHFAFQARKNQDNIGKQKILCIVESKQISRILDYLKPENNKNVCIFGKAIRDWENKVDKIKIQWINEDENYNPNQLRIE